MEIVLLVITSGHQPGHHQGLDHLHAIVPNHNKLQTYLFHNMEDDDGVSYKTSEKLKLVGLEPIDPLFLAAFNIFGKFMHKHG